MRKKKGQIEIALMKGLIISLVVIGGFLIYETIEAETPSGDSITCKWDCSQAEWSKCINGYSYRDISLCVPNNSNCLFSEPKPTNKMVCD